MCIADNHFGFSPIGYASVFDRLSYVEQMAVLRSFLHNFCQRPLATEYHNLQNKYVYDSVFGQMIRFRKYIDEDCVRGRAVNEQDKQYADWFDSFAYCGLIYRVLSSMTCVSRNGNPYTWRPRADNIAWHGLTDSWTKSLSSLMDATSKISPEETVTIIKANCVFGIDVNKLRNVLGIPNANLEDEQEVIFPMDKMYVVDVCTSTTVSKYLESEKQS